VILDMLSALECAYPVAYKEDMTPTASRQRSSRDDFGRERCRRDDRPDVLPLLLRGAPWLSGF